MNDDEKLTVGRPTDPSRASAPHDVRRHWKKKRETFVMDVGCTAGTRSNLTDVSWQPSTLRIDEACRETCPEAAEVQTAVRQRPYVHRRGWMVDEEG